MIQLIFHLLGDYIFQNDWIAQNKTKDTVTGYVACFIHVVIYTLPFLLYYGDGLDIFVIGISHFIIDKFRLATYWIQLINWRKGDNYGFSHDKPAYIAFWLMIIYDNAFHIIINYLAIKYLACH